MPTEETSLRLKKPTVERLGTFGKFNESYDALLNRLMDLLDKEIYDPKTKSFLKLEKKEIKK